MSCLLALSKCAMGQDIIYVHGSDMCQAFDANNLDSVTISTDTLFFGTEANLRSTEIDSVTFERPSCRFIRTGWWGDVGNGRSTYNHQLDNEERPLMEMTASDGVCQSACYFLLAPDTTQARVTHRVGSRWRYVRNTLTGRRKLQFSVQNEQILSYFTTPDYSGSGSYTRLDLGSMLVGKQANDVKRMVSYWHHPSNSALTPSHPVIGSCQINDRSKMSTYQTMTFQDSLKCEIMFWVTDDEVTCDTMRLYFHSSEDARVQFEQMDTQSDEFTRFELWENQIIITEYFQATIDEVKRWLTRLDFEMAQPIIIRKE